MPAFGAVGSVQQIRIVFGAFEEDGVDDTDYTCDTGTNMVSSFAVFSWEECTHRPPVAKMAVIPHLRCFDI